MSAQTIRDLFAPVEAHYREAVLRETWGHLAPEKGRAYPGRLVFAFGVYESGDLNPTVIACDFGGLDGGPWIYEAIRDFLDQFTPGEAGCIYEWTGTFKNYQFHGRKPRLLADVREGAH